MTEGTLDEILWRNNSCERYKQIFLKGRKATEEEAREILDSMVHYESRLVLDYLKKQMNENVQIVEYDTKNFRDQSEAYNLAGFAEVENLDKVLLFSDTSYTRGIYAKFAGLIEAANPNYRWIPSPIGGMKFERKE